MSRPSQHEVLMEVAKSWATRATCTRAQIGAVLAKENRIISTGYNGAPSKSSHCERDVNCFEHRKCYRTIHAEANCIAFAARYGILTEGSVLYTTVSPCVECAKLIINAGVQCVIYLEEYHDATAHQILLLAEIPMISLPSLLSTTHAKP